MCPALDYGHLRVRGSAWFVQNMEIFNWKLASEMTCWTWSISKTPTLKYSLKNCRESAHLVPVCFHLIWERDCVSVICFVSQNFTWNTSYQHQGLEHSTFLLQIRPRPHRTRLINPEDISGDLWDDLMTMDDDQWWTMFGKVQLEEVLLTKGRKCGCGFVCKCCYFQCSNLACLENS